MLHSNYAVSKRKAQIIYKIAATYCKCLLLRLGDAARILTICIGISYFTSRCLYCSFLGNILTEKEKVVSF
jgi:hypothetical protein